MDAQLAAIYGTGNEAEGNDLEKMAAAELLVKLAEEEGVDLSRFSDQEVAGMIADLYKQAEFPPKKDEGKKEEKKEEHEKGESPEKEKKEEEKVAEADFLGRVMAHSMVHELREIEKEAASMAGVKETAGKAVKAVGGFLKGQAKNVKEGVTGIEHAHGAKFGLGVMDRAKKLAPAAGAAAGLTGVALAAKKMHDKGKEKKAEDESALEQLAQQQAFAMAKEAGYIDDQGNFLVEMAQQKEASAVDQAVHARALQICEENGIPVEWNE